jgi:hypothetical protein
VRRDCIHGGGGNSVPLWLKEINLEGFKPEALLLTGASDKPDCELISDDGTVIVDGVESKRLKNPQLKHFRTLRVSLPTMP